MKTLKHFIFKMVIGFWKFNPFKNYSKKVINILPNLKSKLYKDLRMNGVMNIPVNGSILKINNPGFTTIENEIFWNGLDGWEKISIKIWIQLCQDSNTILDIGANSGIYSLIAAATNPKATIYSFEPVKRTIKLFRQNLDLNPEFNIKLIDKAVSNKNGSFEFYDLPHESQYSASLNKDMLSSYSNRISYLVETIKLDSFKELNQQKIDLVKLDVEMHEPEAIEGMIKLIGINRPYILIEILTNDIARKIQEQFKPLNYKFYNIDEKTDPVQSEFLTASDHYNFLFVPMEKDISFQFLHK